MSKTIGLFWLRDDFRPCSSVVEQYPEKVCVVCAIQTKATSNNNSGHHIGLTGISGKI